MSRTPRLRGSSYHQQRAAAGLPASFPVYDRRRPRLAAWTWVFIALALLALWVRL